MTSGLKLLAFVLYTLPWMPLQWLLVRLGHRGARRLPHLYHRGLCRLIGIAITQDGPIQAGGPLLLVANHASWLDIVVLSAVRPLSFIAKREVGEWPFFGTLARLQRTVFVERRRSRVGQQLMAIRRRLEAGDVLVLFPEGTSNDGNRVLPFKSGLFAAVEVAGEMTPIQPVSIAYTSLNGLPLGRAQRHRIAWYGDMDLAPHLWRVLAMTRIGVEVRFHPPVRLGDFGDRKALSAHCHGVIAEGTAALLGGRVGRVDGAPTSDPVT